MQEKKPQYKIPEKYIEEICLIHALTPRQLEELMKQPPTGSIVIYTDEIQDT